MNSSTDGYYSRVSRSYAKLKPIGLIAFSRNVTTLMNGNQAYVNPMPSLATVTAQTNTLETATHEALDGGRLAIATRNAEQAKLLGLLDQLGTFVQLHCNSDLPTLLSSGFDAVRAPSPVGVLPAVQHLRLSLTGISGELLVRWTRQDNAANYTVQTATAVDGPFVSQIPCTSARCLLQGLTPLTTCWVRVCANGSSGAGAWSAVGMATVM